MSWDAFDTIKVTPHNCVRHGSEGQNYAGLTDFRWHLEGRVTWVEQVNRPRSLKLRAVFDRIMWE